MTPERWKQIEQIYDVALKLDANRRSSFLRDTRHDRRVAVKVLPTLLAQNPDRLRRFEQEARATSALIHPNILTVYD